MSVVDIAKELSHLQDLATKGTLTEAHLTGGTFSLSNIGRTSDIVLDTL